MLQIEGSNPESDPIDDELVAKGGVCGDAGLATTFADLTCRAKLIAQAQDDLPGGVDLDSPDLDPGAEQLRAVLDDPLEVAPIRIRYVRHPHRGAIVCQGCVDDNGSVSRSRRCDRGGS